jgi:hypothetical protein
MDSAPAADERLTAEPELAPPRGWRRWLLIGPPALLLAISGAAGLAELARTAPSVPDEATFWSVATAALSIVAALGLVGGRRLGWLLALSIVGWDLAVSLARWWVGSPEYFSLALLAASAWLITSAATRRLYESGATT